MQPLFSIVVPIYNCEIYLKKCLDSLINQSFQNIEIILVDDGSKDQSLEICNQYKEKDNRIKVFSQINAGVSAARNFGMTLATGKWISFVDSDDLVDMELYSKLKYLIDLHNDSQMYCFNYVSDETDRKVVDEKNASEELNRYEMQIGIFEKEYINGFVWNKIFSTNIVRTNNMKFDTEIFGCEDLLFCFNYIKKINKSVYINDSLYHYIKQNGSSSNERYGLKQLTSLNAYEIMIKDESINQKIYRIILQKYVVILLYSLKRCIVSGCVNEFIIVTLVEKLSTIYKEYKGILVLSAKHNISAKLITSSPRFWSKMFYKLSSLRNEK